LVIATSQMIWREKGKELPVATLLNKMHIQWRLAGGKNRAKKGSNDNEELVIPAIATVKKGEIKGGEKKTYENPNKDKICNHCKKKGHMEASCWEKHPDKIPNKISTFVDGGPSNRERGPDLMACLVGLRSHLRLHRSCCLTRAGPKYVGSSVCTESLRMNVGYTNSFLICFFVNTYDTVNILLIKIHIVFTIAYNMY
jgi:hypothetical protein